jgi:hypothetical protein
LTAVVHGSDKSIEVTLEDTPEDQQAQLKALEPYRHKPPPQEVNSDANYGQWRHKFEAGSGKQLGSAADVAAIKALVPPKMPPTIRWVSRSIVVASAYCSDASSKRCLYVFEKRGSKWRLTHHYGWPPQVF